MPLSKTARNRNLGGGIAPVEGELCQWNAPQIKALSSDCDEIFCWGGKGGGKSVAARAFLVQGDVHASDTSPIAWHHSYSYHPGYHGLMLRKNEKDMTEFISRAYQMYRPYGVEWKNGRFEFPSGALIDCGHMKDASSWMKYLGNEYQRIVIDEAALIPDFASYEQLRSCFRTAHPELRRQILLTSNANGPGVGWLTERFLNARRKDGTKYLSDEVIEQEYEDPDTRRKFTRTRIAIFSTYKDNPTMVATGYGQQLATIEDPKMRRAYLDGDWLALFGSYFGDLWRPEGPKQGEPECANHVVPPMKLEPWWGRTISMDWGYAHESAVLWGCQDPNNRLIVYRELVGEQMMADKIGWEIARLSREELEHSPSHSMNLWLSHDAFHNDRGEKTIAELIEQGMAKVLGASAVHVPDIIIKRIRESYGSDVTNWSINEERNAAIEAIRKQRNIGITIRIAPKNDVITWQHVRERMRWESSGQANVQYDADLAHRLLQSNIQAYEEYQKLYRDVKPETLPKMHVTTDCPRLISAIPRVMHEEGTERIHRAHFLGHDSCFIAGTLISAEHGLVKIEDVKEGQLVWTRAGLRRVLAAGMSNDSAETVCVEFSNGDFLRGTPNHPIMANGAWTDLGRVRYNDRLWSASFTKDSPIRGSQPQSIRASGCTFTHPPPPAVGMGLRDYIERFGKIGTDQFLKVIRFITRTKIRSITIFQTWSAFLPEFITLFTQAPRSFGLALAHGRDLRSSRTPIGRGLNQKMGVRKKERMDVDWSNPCGLLNWSVCSAANLSRKKFSRAQGTAPPNAIDSLGLYHPVALSAEPSSAMTSSFIPDSVPVRVLTVAGAERAPVYNLRVDGTPEYFANGILVHNCDALGYLINGLSQQPDPEPFEAFRARKLDEIKAANPGMTPTDLIRTNIALEGHWDEQFHDYTPFTPPNARRAMRVNLERN